VQWAVIAYFFLACLIFGIVITVIVVILKKLFYKKYFLLRVVWKNICLIKTVVEIEVEQKIV